MAKFGKFSRFLFLCIAALPLAVSAGDGDPTPTMGDSYPTRNSLASFYSASPVSFSQLQEGGPGDIDVLVWACHSSQLPEEARDPAVIAGLRRFVESGGGLFLVGFAQSYVVDLGVETIPPDQVDFFRYGYNDASLFGGYFTTGFRSCGSHPILAGMNPSGENRDAFYLNGSSHINLENCFWNRSRMLRGTSLGSCYQKNEKGEIIDRSGTQLLNLWTLGQGRIIGYGNNLLLEDFWFNRDLENLKRFLRNTASFLGGGEDSRIGALPETPSRLNADTYMSPPALPQVQPHSLNRRFPGLPYIGHWGWHAQMNYQRADRKCVDLEYYRDRLIDEPFRWGSNLLEFYPPGMERGEGYPFVWEDDDPVPRPGGDITYWGGDWAPGWNKETARRLFEIAHQRDMLVQLFYHPDPLRFKKGTDGAAVKDAFQHFLSFQSREFQNPLLHGWRASFDGLGTEWWGDARNGEYISRIWQFNPGSYRYSTALLPKTGPYFNGTWMCAFARTGGINACGFGDRWRYVFHPPLYLSYQADCRSLKPSTREWGGWANYGGGSTPDWLVTQAHDFARDRLYLDSGIWWLGQPDATMREEDRRFVYGISSDPLRCAVTSTLRATGSDGYRAKAYGTVDNLPRQYVCDEPFPQDTAFIQNNYFRLLRMGGEDLGILQYDPTRLADFREKERSQPLRTLSPGFISSRPLGVESPSAIANREVVSIGDIDGTSSGFRREGGYKKRYTCQPRDTEFPAEIHYEGWPDWPHEIEVAFTAEAGRYEVEIFALPVDQTCTMEMEMDGRPAGIYFPGPGKKGKFVLPVSLDDSRRHKLLLRAQKAVTGSDRLDGKPGLAHAFDALRIRRTGNESLVHSSSRPVGHQAVLREVACKGSSGRYRQQRTYTVASDFPLLRMDLQDQSPGAVAWETRISLPGYGELIPIPAGDISGRIWQLAARDPGLPPLALFDCSERPPASIHREGDDIVINSPAEPRAPVSLALLINDGLYQTTDYELFCRMLLDQPSALAIGDTPVEYGNRLAIPRVEVVEITNPRGGPYMVAEPNREGETFWLVRGAQPDGESDLLKLYLQPQGTARIQPYGYIEGIVKPGFGCQYSLAIKDDIRPGRCEVEVVKTGPFMFAPRIAWSTPFDRVKLNGKDWRYFDDNLVFLPNRPGRYLVEVELNGKAVPALGRTFLSVDSATWDESRLMLELVTSHPHWWEGPLPGDIPYTALIISRAGKPVRVEGEGSLIDWSEYQADEQDLRGMQANGFGLRIRPGRTRIYFEEDSSADSGRVP